ncbi:major facilitator superfamily domain-containing protein [Lineolata rhizophorae]|uniref:Nitrate/nitrite transporter n=1 Tax=Lineolata rhizophorae TaxID=578093 RepID=A0A6A6P5Y7_9PEZI|nr:major facilitator superfamily domain-containing protein [Lineolata rhizophorae]
MGFSPTLLVQAPEVNPINKKARSIPALNPIDMYGRVFTFAWMGFLIAFWSWYAFPPLMTKTIKADLHLSQKEIANSNILALTATLLVRLVSGPLCDRFGPRLVFAGLLLTGAIPTALAGTVTNATGLIILRFFVGILGATFVPCQVWSTGFFDKNVVGTANALTGGFGNAGGGITYFAMPAIYDSLVGDRGLTPHVAWRVAFIVPFILITACALGMIFLCPDTPTGAWANRMQNLDRNIEEEHNHGGIVSNQGGHLDKVPAEDKKDASSDQEAGTVAVGEAVVIDQYHHESVQNPTVLEILKVMASPQSLVLAACYVNSFGGELAINSILGAYYNKNLELGQTQSGRWAAMFGLVNVLFRPLGGIVSDLLYKYTNGSLWAKKLWIHFVGVIAGCFCLAIGLKDPTELGMMIGLVLGLAVFMDAGNGANFSLVPHVHPYANGIVSGLVGASGNLGGVIFAVIFRFTGNYHQGIWIIGVFFIAINLAVSWIRPIPKGQIGGR